MKKHTNVGSPVTGKGAENAPNDLHSSSKTTRWVAYYRVSTAKQGASGLGLEAQAEAVTNFVAGRGGEIVASFTNGANGGHFGLPPIFRTVSWGSIPLV